MRHVPTIMLLATLLGMGFSCDSNGPPPPKELVCTTGPISGVLMPLEIGNYWEYEETFYPEVVNDTIRFHIREHVEIPGYLDAELLYGGTWYGISDQPGTRREIWHNQSDGVHRSGVIRGDTIAVDFLGYPYPAVSGTEFYWYRYSKDVDSGAWEISDSTNVELVSTDEAIDTPAGQFSTYTFKYYIDPPSDDIGFGSYIYTHLAPGIGIVAYFAYMGASDRDAPPQKKNLLLNYCLMAPE